MIKNRTAQLMYQTAFCTLGIVGILASLGLFQGIYIKSFYVYFTNLSNYLCIGIMFAELFQTVKKKENNYTSVLPVLKFMGIISILLTFFVFNFLLAKENSMQNNLSISNVLLHQVLPLLYVADWFLFYEHKKLKWYYPLLSTLIPLAYVGFIFIRAEILNRVGYLIYPYFFLNVNNIGLGGVLGWIGILFISFVILGYVFVLIDRLIKSPKSK